MNAVARTRQTVRIVPVRLRIVCPRQASALRSPTPGRTNDGSNRGKKDGGARGRCECQRELHAGEAGPGKPNVSMAEEGNERTQAPEQHQHRHQKVGQPRPQGCQRRSPRTGSSDAAPRSRERGAPPPGKSHVVRGFQIFRKSHSPASVTIPERIPAVQGPLNWEMRSCVSAMSSPATSRAGSTSDAALPAAQDDRRARKAR